MMEIESLISDVIPNIIVSWLLLLVIIGLAHLMGNGLKILRNIAKNASNPNAVSEPFSLDSWLRNWFFGLKTSVLSAPNNISMAIKSAWRARKRACNFRRGFPFFTCNHNRSSLRCWTEPRFLPIFIGRRGL